MAFDHLTSVLIAVAAYFAVLAFGLACAWLTDRRRRGGKGNAASSGRETGSYLG
jgi:ABC-type spermidine/putrescine transport system permease subunit II